MFFIKNIMNSDYQWYSHIMIFLLSWGFQSAFFLLFTLNSKFERVEIIFGIIAFEITYTLHLFHFLVYSANIEIKYMKLEE